MLLLCPIVSPPPSPPPPSKLSATVTAPTPIHHASPFSPDPPHLSLNSPPPSLNYFNFLQHGCRRHRRAQGTRLPGRVGRVAATAAFYDVMHLTALTGTISIGRTNSSAARRRRRACIFGSRRWRSKLIHCLALGGREGVRIVGCVNKGDMQD